MNKLSPAPPLGFYVVGGTLRRDALCYVHRRADSDLFEGLWSGKFCYVLTPRQMGKSSLMIRTAGRLRETGADVAVLDLTAAGQNLNVEQWYGSLLNQMGQQLGLEEELLAFWENHSQLNPLQRWMTAVRKIVLSRRLRRLVIFIDEIDAVGSLPFSTDEFFAAIRECYNRRTQDPELELLAFCLLGVATPSDLIRNTRTTPFNIGRRIELDDFTEEEAEPLGHGLNRGQKTNERLLKRILYWTNGHPYLTQRLCQTTAEDSSIKTEQDVDRLCQELFLFSRARERDDNLLFVRERLLRSEVDLTALLELYGRVHRQTAVRDEETNPLISVLQLSGMTRVEHGTLVVRNRIYAGAFDQGWIKSNMPDAEIRRQRSAFRRGVVRTAAIALIITIAVSALALYAFRQRNRAEQQESASRRILYAAQINLAEQAWNNANITRLQELLEKHLPADGQEDLRGFEWYYYWRLLHRDHATITHNHVPTTVALSPDGQLLATAGTDHSIHLWMVSTRQHLARLTGHTNQIWKIAFSPDGTRLASASWDMTAKIWDVPTRQEIKTLRGHTGNVCGLAFSADGSRLATGSWDKQIKLWDVATGRELMTLRGHTDWVWSVAFSTDRQSLASTGEDQTVRLWNLQTGSENLRLTGHHASVYSVSFAPDGSKFATGSNNGDVKLWDARTGHEIATLKGHTFSVFAVAFSHDGKRLASAGVDRVMRIWDVASAKEISQLKGHSDEIRDLAFSSDDHFLATASDDSTVKLWDSSINCKPDVLLHPEEFVDSVSFSPDGKTVITGNRSLINFWDMTSGEKFSNIETGSVISGLCLSPDGKYIAAAHRNQIVTLWNTFTRQQAGILTGHEDAVITVSFSPDGKRLATGSRDHLTKIWDVATKQVFATLSGHERRVGAVAFSPDGKYLATGSDDATVKIWEMNSLREIMTLGKHGNQVWAVAFSPDGTRLASGSYDRTVIIWDWKTGADILTLRGHAAGVKALAFSSDGKRLATGGSDNTIKLWDAESGNELTTLNGHTAVVTALAFSPDGLILASTGRDHAARLWRADKIH